jgi:CRP-like cAMP-binding protein
MFEPFATYLIEKGGLTEEELKQVATVAVPRKIRKRQYLLQEGDVSHYISFVAKGCFRQYRVSKDGVEHILRFSIENWWVSDFESFQSGLPSMSNIDALEDSEVLMIERAQFDSLCKTIPRFNALVEKLTTRNFMAHQARIMSSISETAEERYENFMKSYPQIYQRVPLHMIASFLGVTRETLSRLRRHD